MDRVKLAMVCIALNIEQLCDQDYDFLAEYVKTIKPIANAITYLEGDSLTFGAYLPTLFSVRQALKDLYKENGLVYCKPLLVAVKNGFDRRFGHLMKLPSQHESGDPKAVPLFLAMFTNPDFKLNYIPDDWFDSNPQGMSQIKSLLLNSMRQYLKEEKPIDEIPKEVNQNSEGKLHINIHCSNLTQVLTINTLKFMLN